MRFRFLSAAVVVTLGIIAPGIICKAQTNGEPSEQPNLEQQRMDLMRDRARSIKFTSSVDGFPERVQSEPLFRYDDLPRGYVDGAVWRLGAEGRPLAILTTELHPAYLRSGPRIVYDFLSLSGVAFSGVSMDAKWRPSASAVKMQSLKDAPPPAETPALRLFQMKRIMGQMSASQIVSEEDPVEQKLKLRLLPRPIDRYRPSKEANADGATFLFVAGRMPGVIVFLETDGMKWQLGIGRLSAPSTLTLSLDGKEIYRVPPDFGNWSRPYNASNSGAKIPGYP